MKSCTTDELWVTWIFYKDKYLRGRNPTIPEQGFNFWSEQAETMINHRHVEVDRPPDYLKKCVCAVAEILFIQEQGAKPGELVSESNANYSWKAAEAEKQSDVSAKIRSTINKYLAGTPLHNEFVYRGVR